MYDALTQFIFDMCHLPTYQWITDNLTRRRLHVAHTRAVQEEELEV